MIGGLIGVMGGNKKINDFSAVSSLLVFVFVDRGICVLIYW